MWKKENTQLFFVNSTSSFSINLCLNWRQDEPGDRVLFSKVTMKNSFKSEEKLFIWMINCLQIDEFMPCIHEATEYGEIGVIK